MKTKTAPAKTTRKPAASDFVFIDATIAALAQRAADAMGISFDEFARLAIRDHLASVVKNHTASRNIVPLYGRP
jgi:hypothetical protein